MVKNPKGEVSTTVMFFVVIQEFVCQCSCILVSVVFSVQFPVAMEACEWSIRHAVLREMVGIVHILDTVKTGEELNSLLLALGSSDKPKQAVS